MSFIKNKSGFSLLEVIIALSIGTTGMMFLMRMQADQAKSAATTKANIETEALIGDLRGILMRDGYCSKSFEDLALPNGGITDVINIKNPKGIVRYIVGGKYGNNTLELKSMKIKNFEPEVTDGRYGLAIFEVTLLRLKNINGAKEIKRSIDISLKRDSSNKIVGCETLAAGGLITGGNSKINATIIAKVLNEDLDKSKEGTEKKKEIKDTSKEEEQAKEETRKIIEENKTLKDLTELIKSMKITTEEMNKNLLKDIESN